MNFCIIGLGNHARTKIFPNILSDYKNIYSVTRNNKNTIKNIIRDAILKVNSSIAIPF